MTAAAVLAAVVACSGGRTSPLPVTAAPTGTPTADGPSAPATDVIRIPLSGAAPDAIALDGDTAWVTTGEGGTLVEVDLAGRREVRSIDVGFGPTHLALPDADTVAVGRFSNAGNGSYLVVVERATGAIDGAPSGELGGLTGGDDGIIWALEKAGRLLKVDARTRAVVGDVAVDIGQNVHQEVQWGAGSAWAGSDGTPVTRIAGHDLTLEATITVDTGLPFVVRDGLVWGAGPTQVWAIDPATNEVARRAPLEDVIEILALDVHGDDAWLAVRHPGRVGAVLRLDLASGEVRSDVPVSLPAAIRIDGERVWVASYLDNELLGFER